MYKESDDEREWSHLISLPAHTEFSDVYIRMMEALDRLARIEDKPRYVVLQRFVRIERKLAALDPEESRKMAEELAEIYLARRTVTHLLKRLAKQSQMIRRQARIIESLRGLDESEGMEC